MNWVAHDIRDQVVDFLRHWSERTELPARRRLGWVELCPRQYARWQERYGQVNEHNGLIPRDHWLEDCEKLSIPDFATKHPLEGSRRIAFMMLDADVVAVSPSSVYRVLKEAGLRQGLWQTPTRKGTGFVQPPGARETKRAAVTTLNPADYPTDLIQRTFEFIRQHRAFRAAWVFLLSHDAAASAGMQKYQLLFLMSPSDKALFHDLNLALHCSPPKGLTFDLGVVDETDKVQVMTLFAKASPFYLAQDFDDSTAE